ncbi:MAG: TatD family hydrolase [Sedimentisphaerales bacterium]|nr:TatD family hydrolase [Sedimentisphaerales bacterium]
MELIDTHCHLTFEPLDAEVDAVLERSRAAGVTSWITVGTNLQDSIKAAEFAGRFGNLYTAVGVHPHDAKDVTADTLAELRRLAEDVKVVAIGETGLDFHYNFSKQPDQLRVFAAQLKLARELNLPVVIHSRNAFDETMEVLEQHGSGLRGVVFHCFSGSPEQTQRVLERGYYISFTGVVTFKNAERARQAAKLIPLERLMIETDCPYMSPEPMRKQKVNEPALMIHTAKFLAELKGMDLAEFAAAVTATSKVFFGLPSPANDPL